MNCTCITYIYIRSHKLSSYNTIISLQNKSKATVAAKTVVSSDSSSSGSLSRDQETENNEETKREESEYERKSRLLAENKEKMKMDGENRAIKEQKKKEQREKALREKALKEKEQMDNVS